MILLRFTVRRKRKNRKVEKKQGESNAPAVENPEDSGIVSSSAGSKSSQGAPTSTGTVPLRAHLHWLRQTLKRTLTDTVWIIVYTARQRDGQRTMWPLPMMHWDTGSNLPHIRLAPTSTRFWHLVLATGAECFLAQILSLPLRNTVTDSHCKRKGGRAGVPQVKFFLGWLLSCYWYLVAIHPLHRYWHSMAATETRRVLRRW